MPNTVNSYMVTDLGNVSLNPRGEYNATYDYEYLDLVYYKGGSYVCLAPLGETITNIAPIIGQTTTNWQCVAIPGDITPEYISMYNEVVKDYNETNTNTANVAQMKDSVYASMTASQESANKASASEVNARASEVSAKQSMDKAKEYSDEAIRANNDTQSLVTGFDEHVATAISNAEASISESTDSAKDEIIAQKSSSLNEFRTDAETVMTNEKNVAVTEIHQMVDDFSADADSKKQEVIQVADEKINDMTALKNDAVNAKNAAETAATIAVEKASETATYAGEAKSSSDEAKANADLVAADKAIVAADKTEIGGMKSAVESSVAKFESDLETYNLPTMNNDINELKSDLTSISSTLVDVNSICVEVEKEVTAEYRVNGAYMNSNTDMTKVNVEQSSNRARNTAKFYVEEGKKYRISCTYGGNTRYDIGYAFTDSSKNFLAYKVREDGGTAIIDDTFDVIAPVGSAYLYVNRINLYGEANAVEIVESTKKEYTPKSYYKSETYSKTEVEDKIDEKIADTNPKHKTCIMFNFDAPPQFVSDGRKGLLDKYRVPYTVNITVIGATTATYPDSSKGKNYIYEIIRDGNDFAIYSSSATKPAEDASVYNGGDDSIELFETYIKEAKECAERFGIFNPTAWFCRFMRTGTAMNQALINCGFKICRGYKYGVTPAESTNVYIKDWNNHDKQMFNVNAQSIKSDGIEGTKTRIDIAIENGWDLAPFAHGIYNTQEEADANNGITKDVFEAVLVYARQKADEGLCELVTFRDYYRMKYPADGGMNDIVRERKYSDWKYGQTN